jgi:hypothetical protein
MSDFSKMSPRGTMMNQEPVAPPPPRCDATDRTRDEEVERLKKVGGTEYEDHRKPDGTGWVMMVDPEGNLFCVERSAAELV